MNKEIARKIVFDLEAFRSDIKKIQHRLDIATQLVFPQGFLDDYFAQIQIDILRDESANTNKSVAIFLERIESAIRSFRGLIRHYEEKERNER